MKKLLFLLLLSPFLAFGQTKGDNYVLLSGTSIDSVVNAFGSIGYNVQNVTQVSADLTQTRQTGFGQQEILIHIFKRSDGVLLLNATTMSPGLNKAFGSDKYQKDPVVFNWIGKKQFLLFAAQAAKSGGKISFAKL